MGGSDSDVPSAFRPKWVMAVALLTSWLSGAGYHDPYSQQLLKYRKPMFYKCLQKTESQSAHTCLEKPRDIFSLNGFKTIFWVYFLSKIPKARMYII